MSWNAACVGQQQCELPRDLLVFILNVRLVTGYRYQYRVERQDKIDDKIFEIKCHLNTKSANYPNFFSFCLVVLNMKRKENLHYGMGRQNQFSVVYYGWGHTTDLGHDFPSPLI